MSDPPLYAASVVIVCDYASGSDQGLEDLRRAMTAVAAQDVAQPIEYILTESEDMRDRLPQDVLEILPSLRVVFSPARTSCGLRNHGVRAATCEIVATLDADCTPNADWLRHLIEDLRRHPEAAAVSGWTEYAGETFLSRASGSFQRSFHRTSFGPTPHLSPASAGFRRAAFVEHLLPTHLGPFAARLQSESMQKAGWGLLFDPRMRVRHAFTPGFYSTYHYNAGYATVRTRLESADLNQAWLTRLGYFSVPFFFGGRLLHAWLRALRSWRHYGVRWFELPAVFPIALWGSLIEIRGMLRALRGQPPPVTLFR